VRKLDTLEIFDWYDGIVTALVRPSWTTGTFLASLLTWAQPQKLRVFGLIPITEAQVALIRQQRDCNWNEQVIALRELSRKGAEIGLIVRLDESTENVTGVASVASADIADEMRAGVEHALDPSTARWLVEPNWS
jgi:hypothetical protein